MKKSCIFLLFIFHFSFFIPQNCFAQYTVLLNFNGINGSLANCAPVVSGSNLYCMTSTGGLYDSGCIFVYNMNTQLYTDLFDFNGANGYSGTGSLILSGNMLYGMTELGGVYGQGNVFAMDTNGYVFRNLLSFNGLNGQAPNGTLTLSRNKLYGATYGGGAFNWGNIFSIDTDGGEYKDLHDFDSTDGAWPLSYGALALSGGTLYGTAHTGGDHDIGTVFSVDTSGSNFKVLINFGDSDYNGNKPEGDITVIGNKLFGATYYGGLFNLETVFSVNTDGTGYKDLLDFNGGNGANSSSSLVYANGVLYGMSSNDANNGYGNIFSINTDGSNFTDLYDFSQQYGGAAYGNLTFSGNTLYGVNTIGGTNNFGVLFSFEPPKSTGIAQVKGESGEVKVYPNPSSGKFAVEVESGKLKVESAKIEVFNVLGEQVYSQFSIINSPLSIDLSSNPSGVYLYKVIANSGEIIGEGKLVIQK